MANDYYVDLVVRGRESDLDKLESILQQEINGGQTRQDYYTFYKSIAAMGFDPSTVESRRAYTEQLQRQDSNILSVRYCGAWSFQPGVLRCIHKRWPDFSLRWQGIDEFGQEPHCNDKDLEGKYQLEDDDLGLEPFQGLDEWKGEEAVPYINRYYGTDVKTVEEAIDTIDGLCSSMPMVYVDDSEIYTEEQMNKIQRT